MKVLSIAFKVLNMKKIKKQEHNILKPSLITKYNFT